jgi:hypothetical protein
MAVGWFTRNGAEQGLWAADIVKWRQERSERACPLMCVCGISGSEATGYWVAPLFIPVQCLKKSEETKKLALFAVGFQKN